MSDRSLPSADPGGHTGDLQTNRPAARLAHRLWIGALFRAVIQAAAATPSAPAPRAAPTAPGRRPGQRVQFGDWRVSRWQRSRTPGWSASGAVRSTAVVAHIDASAWWKAKAVCHGGCHIHNDQTERLQHVYVVDRVHVFHDGLLRARFLRPEAGAQGDHPPDPGSVRWHLIPDPALHRGAGGARRPSTASTSASISRDWAGPRGRGRTGSCTHPPRSAGRPQPTPRWTRTQ